MTGQASAEQVAKDALKFADLIESGASVATEGPWWRHYADPETVWWGNESDVHAADAGVIGDAEAERILDYESGPVCTPMTATDAAYIATVHPLVGAGLADLLRELVELHYLGCLELDQIPSLRHLIEAATVDDRPQVQDQSSTLAQEVAPR